MSVFRDKKPWEADHTVLTDREYTEEWDAAEASQDWLRLSELQQPDVSGEVPAGLVQYDRPDFIDRR